MSLVRINESKLKVHKSAMPDKGGVNRDHDARYLVKSAGWSGWFDDGTNFRVTVVNGQITNVANSTAGGHNP